MLPEPELAWASECLLRCAGHVSSALEAEYQFLAEEVQQFDCRPQLPPSLIHNDCNFGNVILTSVGKVALIDWEGAGLGPALLDIGFVLSACFDKANQHLNTDALCAFIKGYCRSRRLTDGELDSLGDAVRYGATYADWQAQYQASSEIAETAQKALRQFQRR